MFVTGNQLSIYNRPILPLAAKTLKRVGSRFRAWLASRLTLAVHSAPNDTASLRPVNTPRREKGEPSPSHRSGPEKETTPHSIPPKYLIDESSVDGARMIVGCDASDSSDILHLVTPLGDGRIGLVVLHNCAESVKDEVSDMLSGILQEASAPQEAVVILLQSLDQRYSSVNSFIGIWESNSRTLTYVAAGFEQLSVLNAGWPHQPDMAIERQNGSGMQKVAFGVHRLSKNERWLLYTSQLVDVANPHIEPFNTVGIIQYAHNDRRMPGNMWVRYLLELGARAHGGKLPAGSVIVSLICDPINATAEAAQRASQVGEPLDSTVDSSGQ